MSARFVACLSFLLVASSLAAQEGPPDPERAPDQMAPISTSMEGALLVGPGPGSDARDEAAEEAVAFVQKDGEAPIDEGTVPPASEAPPPPPVFDAKKPFGFGFAAGMTTGLGPSFTFHLTPNHALSVTFVPMYFDDEWFVSGGARYMFYLRETATRRFYTVVGAAVYAIDGVALVSSGIGAGIEYGKPEWKGVTLYADVALTALTNVSESGVEFASLLPLPSAGFAWSF